MSAHTEQRLETPGGTVVAYLAPTMEVSPTFDNSLNSNPIPDSQKTIVRDLRLFEHEIVFQGTFSHSDDLPQGHQTDLKTLFGSLPVTARDQVNRIIRFAYEQGGPFYLYDGSDQYTAESASNIDVANGVFPVVQVGQIRASREETFIREGFTLQFSIGLEDPL